MDVGLSRTTWIRVLGLGAAVLTVAAYLQPLPAAANRFTTLLFMANILGLPMRGAIGALACERLPASLRSMAAGWIQAGNLGGMAIAGSTAIWCAGRYPLQLLSVVIPAFMAIPIAASFLIRGDRPPRSVTLTGQLARLWSALRNQAKLPATRQGLVFFLSPTGAAAASFLFSGIAVDYKTRPETVAFVTGVLSTLLSAVGAIAGGHMSRSMGGRVAYVACGLLTGAAAVCMAFAPLVPASYILGVGVYVLIAGCGFAAYTSLSLELIQADSPAASTLYAAFNCLGNLPVAYSIWLDGIGFRFAGPKGLLSLDAGLEIVSSLVLLGYIYFLRRRLGSSEISDAPEKSRHAAAN